MSNPTEPEQLVLLEVPAQPEEPCEWDFLPLPVTAEEPAKKNRPKPGWVEIAYSMVIRTHTEDIVDITDVVFPMPNADVLDKAAGLSSRICGYLDSCNTDWKSEVYHYGNKRLAEYKAKRDAEDTGPSTSDPLEEQPVADLLGQAQRLQLVKPPAS